MFTCGNGVIPLDFGPNQWRGGERERKRRRKEREEEVEREALYIVSRFFGDWTVGFHRSKRESYFSRRELQVETGNWEFRQTSRVRGFSPT